MTRVRSAGTKFERPTGVAEGSVVSVFRVPPEVAGQRLDVFVQGQLRRTSRSRTQKIVRASAYDSSGRRLKPNDRVHAEQHILLWRAPWDEVAVPTDLDVLFEDEHLLALDKPPNLPVHPTARYHRNTLIKLLQAERPGQFLTLAHRIDRETSGVIMVSKTRECDRVLKRRLEARDGIEKFYLAITWGVPYEGRSEAFRLERNVALDLASPYRVKMRVSDQQGSLYAATRFVVEAQARRPDGRLYALVRCELETGRQHQIRVHLASLGTPIVGDKLYGPDESAFSRGADGELTPEDAERLELPRHALHASRLELAHPITGAPLSIAAPLPADMRTFWAQVSG